MAFKTLLTYKGLKYMCIAATVPGTAVVTHTNNVWINKQVAKVHRPAPVRKPPVRVAYKPTARTGITSAPLPVVPVVAEQSAVALCPPTGGGLSGGGGSGGAIGIGGGYIGGLGGTLPPVSTPGTVSPVPEPSTWFGMMLGFGTFGIVMRSNRRKAKAHEQL